MSEWQDERHVARYISRADALPREEAENVLLGELPRDPKRVLDLGSGDGRLLARVLDHCPGASGVALDFSDAMIGRLEERFESDARVQVVSHDLTQPLGDIGSFDAVVSAFAIHHLEHDRKRELYGEVVDRLGPGGVFCNLDHVASPSERVHLKFLAAIGYAPSEEDPSNRLLDMQVQLSWFRELGLVDVDCYWKWRELALLVGVSPE
jgi:tRNA (cmo5U34)-methyltransferase